MKYTTWAAFLGAGIMSVLFPAVAFGATALYVDTNGSVGIGNTSPQSALDISGAEYSRLVNLSSSSTPTVNWNAGNVQQMTLTSNSTPSFTNGQAGGEYKLILNQDNTGSRTVTWPMSVLWPGNTPPTLTTTASSTDVISFLYDGARYLGSFSLGYGGASGLLAGLDSYWKTDESSGTAFDSVGSNNLTNNNSATYTAGKINNGILMAAASSQSMSKSSPSGIPGAGNTGGDMTVSLWTKLTSQPATNIQVPLIALFDGNTGSFRSWILYYLNDASSNKWLRFASSADGASSSDCKLSQTLSTGTWYYITIVYKAGVQCEIFVNGSSIGTGPASASLFNTSANLVFGNDSSLTNAYLDGEEDEIGIWSRALSSGEISQLYNSGVGLQYPF